MGTNDSWDEHFVTCEAYFFDISAANKTTNPLSLISFYVAEFIPPAVITVHAFYVVKIVVLKSTYPETNITSFAKRLLNIKE